MLSVCSTPFGIIGIFTTSALNRSCRKHCAQRLSASLESSPFNRRPRSIQIIRLCSTPFGIIGIFTPRSGVGFSRVNVLNAFRHHWNLHGFLSRTFPVATVLCSTPFGIIGIFTRSPASNLSHSPVLNAFRHHWNLHWVKARETNTMPECSTPFGIIGIFTVHTWFDARGVAPCSTPFGIIGIFTGHARALATGEKPRSAQRLSASLESSRP